MTLDSSTLRKFRRPAPDYATYPAPDRFIEAYDAPALANWITAGNAFGMRNGVTLEIRFPLTMRPIFGTKLDQHSGSHHDWYPHHLEREARLAGQRVSQDTVIDSMHWSGSAGALAEGTQARLLDVLRENFPFAASGAFSADVNPLVAGSSTLARLRQAGATRVEIGTPNLAGLSNDRIRWHERQARTSELVQAARQEGMTSIGADLIYGDAEQTRSGVEAALKTLLASEPDRITLRQSTPGKTAKDLSSQLEMLRLCAAALADAAYLCIGIDHFARAGDQLAVAHRQGRLTRLPHGYAPRPSSTILALGPGAIGIAGPTYYQNHRNADDYCSALDRGALPVMRGLQLTPDDMVRRAIIHSFSTNLFVDIEVIETTHQLDFRSRFAAELQELASFEAAGLLQMADGMITLAPSGYLMLGTLCLIFDSYARQSKHSAPYPA